MARQFSQFTQNRSPIMSQNGPIRTKKRAGFFQSVFGVLIGFILVLGSPFIMWSAGSQNTAKDFSKAEVVEAASSTEGYIAVRSTPEYSAVNGGDGCYKDNCIYEVASNQKLVTSTELICSNNVKESETLRIIQKNGVECDDETGECVPCYDVEKDSWDESSSKTVNYDVKLGSYTVAVGSNAIFLDLDEETVNTDFDFYDAPIERTVYSSFVMPKQLLVAGQSDGSFISKPAKKVMVISKYDNARTLEALKSRDKSARLMLWIATFVALFIGFSMMFGPIEWAARMFGKIPAVGPFVRQGSRAMISLLAFLLAFVIWIIEWLLVSILQNIWIAAIALLLIGGVVFWIGKRGDKQPVQGK